MSQRLFEFQALDHKDRLIQGSLEAQSPEQAREVLSERYAHVLLITQSVEAETSPAPKPPPSRRKVVYLFKALDRGGNIIEGSLFAPSVGVAFARLEKMYEEVISIREKNEAPAQQELAPVPTSLSPEAISLAFRQLCFSVSVGVGLLPGLKLLLNQDNEELQPLFRRVAGSVESGRPFSLALREQGQAFDEALVAMVRSGEAVGGLAASLERVSRVLEGSLWIRKRSAAVFAYPLALGAVCLTLLLLFLAYSFPLIKPMVGQASVAAPGLTLFLLSLGERFSQGILGPLCLAGGLLLILTLFALVREVQRPARERAWDRILFHLPGLGELFRQEERTRAVQAMAALLEAGIHPSKVLGITARSHWSPHLSEGLKRAGESYTETLSLSRALEKHQVFAGKVIGLLQAGEESECLPDTAKAVARAAEVELDELVERLQTCLEPISITLCGGVALLISVAAFLPMISLLLEL